MNLIFCFCIAGCTFGAVGTDKLLVRALFAASAAFGLCMLVVTT